MIRCSVAELQQRLEVAESLVKTFDPDTDIWKKHKYPICGILMKGGMKNFYSLLELKLYAGIMRSVLSVGRA